MSEKRELPPTWKQRKATIKRKWTIPFQRIEWACEWGSYRLSQWGFIEVLEYAGKLAVVVTVILYFASADERRQAADDARKAKHYQAWQMILGAEGKIVSAGRVSALEDLLKDGISLEYVNLDKAFLPRVVLTNANLRGANLNGAQLPGANLSKANLSFASLKEVLLADVNMDASVLIGADLRKADVSGITNWNMIKSVEGANFAGLKHPPSGFQEFLKSKGAVFLQSDKDWLPHRQKIIDKINGDFIPAGIISSPSTDLQQDKPAGIISSPSTDLEQDGPRLPPAPSP